MTAPRLVPALALTVASAALIFASTAVVGCSEAPAPDAGLARQFSELRETIDALRASTETVATDVKRQNRRIDDLSRRIAELGGEAAGGRVTVARAERSKPDPTSPSTVDPTVDLGSNEVASEVATVLASEEGRAALAQAARGAIAENAARQRDGFVAYSLAQFAQEANLSDSQAKDVRKTWDDVMERARSVMRDARPTAEMTAEERAASVATIRAAMRDLGTQREERMRTILDDTQYELYQKREKEIDAGLHGAPPPPRTENPSDEEPVR